MTVEWGILFAFAAMLSWGIGDFLIQRSVKKIGTVEALAVIGVVGTFGLLPFVWKDILVLFQPENATLVFWLGVITFIAAVLDFYALKIGKLSVIEFVLELELPITVLLGIFFFKEVLSTNQIVIICLAFIGIALIFSDTLTSVLLICGRKGYCSRAQVLFSWRLLIFSPLPQQGGLLHYFLFGRHGSYLPLFPLPIFTRKEK